VERKKQGQARLSK